MGDEKRDVLDRLSGWGFDGLKEAVRQGREAADKGVWGLSINAAKGEDANRISAAYSALWANAPMLLEIVEDLAQEVREWRGKPKEVDCGGLIANLRATLKLAQEDVAKWQHRAREYQLDANAHKANFDAELEGNKKLREKFGARDNETWRQWLERMASEAAEAQKRAAKLTAAFPAELEGCTLVYRQCGRGHGDITATNWVQHACPTCALEDAKAERDHWKNLAARAIAARDVAQAQSAEFQVDIARCRAEKAVSDE